MKKEEGGIVRTLEERVNESEREELLLLRDCERE